MREIGEARCVGADADRFRAELLHGGVEFGLAAAGDVDGCAFVDEALGGGEANACAATGDDCDFSFELAGHDSSPF
jgi:hypothetical protein